MNINDCNPPNVIGHVMASAEFGGKDVTEEGLKALKLKEKLGYAGASGKLHREGVSENPSEAIAEQIKKFRDMGLKQAGASGLFRDPLTLFGEDIIRPIIDATAQWKQTVLDQGLSRVQARELYDKNVVPVVKEQQSQHFSQDAQGYYKFMAYNYYRDMLDGREVFGGENDFITNLISKGTGYFTGYAPHIAFYDVTELITKGMTQYGPWHFTKGMATMLIKTKGYGAFLHQEENSALYHGTHFAETPGLKTKGKWLLEHINPQYYSNNLLVNGSAEIGRSAGVDPAEAVRKIGFIKEIGNSPQYLRRGGAETLWARYSTEAAKFYLDIHADLGRAIMNKDPKAFAAAMGQVITFHALMTGAAGVGASLPVGVDKAVQIAAGSGDDTEFYERMNQALPFANVLGKMSGQNVRKGLQFGAPAFGIGYSATFGMIGKVGANTQKAIQAAQQNDYATAAGLSLESLQMAAALKWRNPVLTNQFKNYVKLGAQYTQPGEDWNQFPADVGSVLLTGKLKK